MSSDWRKSLRSATFRGAHFWVETDSFEGGRRLHVHEFPNGELAFVEDLGGQAKRFSVDAYVVGEQAGPEASALVQACAAPSAATLVLPLFGTIRAHCQDIRTDRSKDKHGYVGFRLFFIAAGAAAPLAASGNLRRQVELSGGAARAPIALAFSTLFNGLRVADFVRRSAIDTGRSFLEAFDVARIGAPLSGAQGAWLDAEIQDLYEDMEELVTVGRVGDSWGERSYVAQAAAASTAPLTDRIFTLLDTFRQAADADLAATVLSDLLSFGEDFEDIPRTTLNRRREAVNRESMVELFRRSALVQWAMALMDASYSSRRAAIAARAEVAMRFGEARSNITRPEAWEVALALGEIEGKLIEFLSQTITDLAPVNVVEASRQMPSLYWSWRLYGTAQRGTELWTRNSVKHPGWMPSEFEALSR